MSQFFFLLLSTLLLGCSLGVVLARNPVGSLLFMVTALAGMAGIFVLLEAHFLAALQIIVYAGAILVLFLFVIMLLNLGHDYRKDLKGGLSLILSFLLTGGIAAIFLRRVPGAFESDGAGGIAIDAAQRELGAVGAVAHALFTDHLVAFEITGILLTVAIVGAIALAKRKV